MFAQIKRRLHDMKTLSRLCDRAETIARDLDQELPGAEHFVLAAIDMPDASVKRIFKDLGADAGDFVQALQNHHSHTLQSIGIEFEKPATPDHDHPPISPPTKKHYKAAASGQDLLRQMASQQKYSKQPLQGAHVLLALAELHEGVAHRALKFMGLEPQQIAVAAKKSIEA